MKTKSGVTINLDYYAARLQRRLEGHVATMRIVLRALDDGSYVAKSAPRPEAGFIGFQLSNLNPPEELAWEERRKTILAIVRSFVDFIDTLIAIRKICAMPQELTRALNGFDEINAYIEALVATRTQKVGKDGHLSAHDKRAMFTGLTPFLQDAMTGFFELRAALEHHKGVAQAEIVLCLKHVDFLVNNTASLEDTGYVLQAGDALYQVITDGKRTVDSGETIDLTEKEIDAMVRTISLFILPGLVKM